MSCKRIGPQSWGMSLFAATVVLLAPMESAAQGASCVSQATGFPQRHVIRCAGGLAIEAAAGADYTLIDKGKDGIPDSADVRGGAVLVNAPPARSRGSSFQIHTPQAVAAVRGTEWAVDVATGKTAVFVIAGQVSVRRATARSAVTLGPGEGVDVEPGTVPLQVKRWSAGRAAALLARFGR